MSSDIIAEQTSSHCDFFVAKIQMVSTSKRHNEKLIYFGLITSLIWSKDDSTESQDPEVNISCDSPNIKKSMMKMSIRWVKVSERVSWQISPGSSGTTQSKQLWTYGFILHNPHSTLRRGAAPRRTQLYSSTSGCNTNTAEVSVCVTRFCVFGL